jgi:phospholipid transport system substrate-binding protein
MQTQGTAGLCNDNQPERLIGGTVTLHFLSAIFDRVTSKPIVPKAAARKAVALATGLAIAMLACPAYAALTSGGDTVQGLYDALLGTMKSGRTLGQSGRFARLEPVIRRTFDITTMARLSVGSSWATLSEAQRRQVVASFGRYISAIYAERFDSYGGQKLQVTGEQPAAGGIMVKSQIIKASGEPVNVDYLMRRNGDTWLISDIYLDGAISEVATRRSEFGAILKNEGIDGLITALNRKADILNGSTQALSRTNPGAEVAGAPARGATMVARPGGFDPVVAIHGQKPTRVRTGLTPAARHQHAASIKKLQVSKTSIKKLQVSKTSTKKLQVSKNRHSPPVSLALNGARTVEQYQSNKAQR